MVLILLFGQLGLAKDVIFQRMSPPPSSLPIPEKIKNQTLILANDDNLIICLDVYDGTTSFTRVMKTDLNGGLIWSYDYGMTFTAQAPVLHPFSITRDINGSGYVICGARDNVNHDTLSNDLTPFTLAIDENGSYVTSRTYYHSVTPADLSAVALKIVATPQGNYAMTGFQGYEFNYLTTNQGRRGFLHILDGNLNTTNYVAFHGYYSGYLWSNCKYDLFGEVISFFPSGAQDEVYFVAGAVTDSGGWLGCSSDIHYWGIGLLYDNSLNLIWQTEAYKENTFIGAYYDTASDQIFATTAGSGSAEHSGLFAIDAITGAFNQQIAFTGATPSQVGEFTSHIYQFNHVEVKDDTLLLFGYSHGYITIVGLNPFNKDTAYIPVYFKVDKNDFNNIFESWMFKDENTPISLLSGDYSELLGMNYQKFINGRNDSIQNCGGSITTNVKYKTPLVYGPKSFVDFNGAIYFISFEGPGSSYAPKLKTSYPSEICSKKIFLSYLEEVYTLDINPITDLPDYWDELIPDPNSRTPIFSTDDCDPLGPSPFFESDLIKINPIRITYSYGNFIEINNNNLQNQNYQLIIYNLLGIKLVDTIIIGNQKIQMPIESSNSVFIFSIIPLEDPKHPKTFKIVAP